MGTLAWLARILGPLIVVAILAGCSGQPPNERPDIGDDLRAAVAAASPDSTTIDFAEVIDLEWDYVQVMWPDSNNNDAYDLLGFQWPVEDTGAAGFFDQAYRIVVVADSQVIAWFRWYEDGMWFCRGTQRLDRGQALLSVMARSDGGRYLVTPAEATTDLCDFGVVGG